MSLLAPLFLFGAFAIAAPVLFHLIRRSPQGQLPFSSLMFLAPSPPRLTRRSRLDHLLLLLLRAAAFCLLVLAFARPFLREAAALNREAADRQRVVVLVDTSASLRRGDLWEQALAAAEATLAKLRPQDEWAVLAFDQGTRPVVGFAELAALDPGQRPALAMSRLRELTPTWQSTELPEALIDAVGAVNE
ncbi:MAG: BatA domain-containing protein, partial [Planctomycetia bacterium]|nr:BatA domain-containing protein [Planctomycetia bacterium]